MSAQSPARRVRRLAFGILLIGWLAAFAVYVAAMHDQSAAGDAAVAAAFDNSAREMQQVERLGGTAAVMTLRFHRWFTSLWHGQRLAYTLAVLSALVALLCLHIADLMAGGDDD